MNRKCPCCERTLSITKVGDLGYHCEKCKFSWREWTDALEREKYQVPIDPGGIFWKIKPVAIQSEKDGVLVKLEWGWTAGFTEEDWKNYAEDAPRGHEEVITDIDMAKELRDDLNKILEKYETEGSNNG